MYLNCKTYFSFHCGTFSTRELVEKAVEQGVAAVALTNINGTADVWDFVKLCRDNKVKPIVDTEIPNGDQLLYIPIGVNIAAVRGSTAFCGIISFRKWISRSPSNHLPNSFLTNIT